MPQDTSRVTARSHAGLSDLPALLAFAGRSLRARFPLEAEWHPGDLVWQLKDAGDATQDMRLWETPSGLAAVAWFVGPGGLWLECLPDHEHLVAEILDWAQETLRAERPRLGKSKLSVQALDSDGGRVAAFEARGYERTAPEGVRFRRALHADIPPPILPDGVRMRDCLGVDPELRASCHRDAWNHLDHIGIENARSTFTAETYRRLLGSPGYDPALDILAVSADGRLAANCICWADSASGVGTIEPVGTHVDFRGQGLARAVNIEGLRRLKARGMAWGRVSTAHFNTPAIATYQSCGFEIIDRTSWWTKRLS